MIEQSKVRLSPPIEHEYLQNYEAFAELVRDLEICNNEVIDLVANFDFHQMFLIYRANKNTGDRILKLFVRFRAKFISLTRLHDTMKLLLDHFGDNGITITPDLLIDGMCIDLFIQIGKTKKRRYFALILNSKGSCRVRWFPLLEKFKYSKDREVFNAETQTYQYRNGLSWVRFTSLCDKVIPKLKATLSLRKEKHPLLGERSNPIIKAIVFSGRTRLDPQHTPELWVKFGNTTALKIDLGGVFYVLNEENLIDFLMPPNLS
jgi:hypothetical protein